MQDVMQALRRSELLLDPKTLMDLEYQISGYLHQVANPSLSIATVPMLGPESSFSHLRNNYGNWP